MSGKAMYLLQLGVAGRRKGGIRSAPKVRVSSSYSGRLDALSSDMRALIRGPAPDGLGIVMGSYNWHLIVLKCTQGKDERWTAAMQRDWSTIRDRWRRLVESRGILAELFGERIVPPELEVMPAGEDARTGAPQRPTKRVRRPSETAPTLQSPTGTSA